MAASAASAPGRPGPGLATAGCRSRRLWGFTQVLADARAGGAPPGKPGRRWPAGRQPGAFPDPEPHQGGEPVVVVSVRQRTDLRRRVGRVADADAVGPLGEAADEGVVDR